MATNSTTEITVVVPVFNAYSALQQCLHALEKHTPQSTRVVLIDDASTDNRIAPMVEGFAQHNGWQIVKQNVNRGFVKTANAGLRLTPGHTLLLNADALVTPQWLEAFQQVIEKIDNLATATPWSNNAEICSFPDFLRAQPVPAHRDHLATALHAWHKPRYPEIPTGVGFCFLVTAQAKKQLGYFDEETFGHGYGEENDYCLRANGAGLKNVLVDNAYVAHIGNQSFVEMNMQPSTESMRRLLNKHPQYAALIDSFIQADPLAKLRREIMQTFKKHQPELVRELLTSVPGSEQLHYEPCHDNT